MGWARVCWGVGRGVIGRATPAVSQGAQPPNFFSPVPACTAGVGLGVSRAGRPDGSQAGAALEIFYSLVKAWVCCRGRPGCVKGGAP